MGRLFVVGFLAAVLTATLARVVPLGPLPTIAALLVLGLVLYFALDALLYSVLAGGL